MKQDKIKNVIVDLGGVQFASTGKDSPLINWKVITDLNWIYGHDLNVGKDRFAEFLAAYEQRTGIKLDGNVFLKAIFDTLEINQDLIAFLRTQFEQVFILSDNYRENIHYIADRYQFQTWADRQFYSFEFGMTKEDSRLFENVLQTLGLSADEVCFIDDSLHKIEVARSVGIRSYLFKNNKDLFSILISEKST